MVKNQKKILDSYLFAIIKGFVEQAKALYTIEHKPTKGHLREAFTQNLLKHFLPAYLDVGSGVIINNQGYQSKETDIIIYDNRLLPAFLFSNNLNIFPVVSVVGAVELKSFLNRQGLIKSEKDAKHLIDNIWAKNKWLIDLPPNQPLSCLFSLDGNRIRGMSTNDNTWINANIYHLRFICSVGKFSWVLLYNKKAKKVSWAYGKVDSDFHEIRRFIAVLTDNLRRQSTQNWLWSASKHNDWLGQYIRKF